MKIPVFTGVCTALVTPFLGQQTNFPMVEQLIRRQIECGVSAIVLAGTTGESPTLTDDEKIALFKKGTAYAGSRCKIIAGTGSNSTAHAVDLSIEAEKTGVDALLVVTPYYNKTTSEGLIGHYLAIAEAVSIPIILYNVPSRTGIDIPVAVYKQLSTIPNIIGVKEASTDIAKINRIRTECPPDFYIWAGNDDQITPVMSTGGCGVISVVSNICPRETVALTSAALSGDFRTAATIQAQLTPLIELLFCEVNPIPAKEAMKMIGFDCGSCRLPLVNLSRVNRLKLEKYFA